MVVAALSLLLLYGFFKKDILKKFYFQKMKLKRMNYTSRSYAKAMKQALGRILKLLVLILLFLSRTKRGVDLKLITRTVINRRDNGKLSKKINRSIRVIESEFS